MRVLFLDIDGVLQPFTDYRHDHSCEEVRALCRELNERFRGDFDYDAWAGDKWSNPFWTVAAVHWDWDAEAVAELKRVLEATGAKIVLSSSWRSFGFDAMKALFRLWGLDEYYFDNTMLEFFSELDDREEGYAKEKARSDIRDRFQSQCKVRKYIDTRAVEILEWLDRHPDVTGYAAVDDMDLAVLLEGHFVQTQRRLEKAHADALIAALNRDGGPFLLPEDIRAMPELEVLRRKAPAKESAGEEASS